MKKKLFCTILLALFFSLKVDATAPGTGCGGRYTLVATWDGSKIIPYSKIQFSIRQENNSLYSNFDIVDKDSTYGSIMASLDWKTILSVDSLTLNWNNSEVIKILRLIKNCKIPNDFCSDVLVLYVDTTFTNALILVRCQAKTLIKADTTITTLGYENSYKRKLLVQEILITDSVKNTFIATKYFDSTFAFTFIRGKDTLRGLLEANRPIYPIDSDTIFTTKIVACNKKRWIGKEVFAKITKDPNCNYVCKNNRLQFSVGKDSINKYYSCLEILNSGYLDVMLKTNRYNGNKLIRSLNYNSMSYGFTFGLTCRLDSAKNELVINNNRYSFKYDNEGNLKCKRISMREENFNYPHYYLVQLLEEQLLDANKITFNNFGCNLYFNNQFLMRLENTFDFLGECRYGWQRINLTNM